MSSTVPGFLYQAKKIASIAVYSLVSFALAGLLVGVLPEAYHSAVLVGWVVSLFIVATLLKNR